MRRIAWIVLLLIGLGEAAVELPPTDPPGPAAAEPAWRRTRDGWQRKEHVRLQTPGPRPPLHPLTVGAFQLLASCWALGAVRRGAG